ncbi:FadR family transcriptional regulator [Bacillus infantis]|uniref:FadR/GntR family transcriptional regulator n=1 Tax=Bacillus infantis TaxID=324767 RepID=UPI002004C22C|nr:FadR/GntR family transcriptional regulator [Bacillus infantis]MCK6206099.1 FadR family transcriptional regulator [Bacillus infantis]
MITPIERKKVSAQILDELKRMIKDKEFPADSKLPSENELAKMFGVSRSPIREALRVLEAGGLVESRQGGGSYVREVNLANMLDSVTFEMISIDQVYDLLEMRTVVETEAAAFAALRASSEEVEKIRDALDAFAAKMEDDQSIGSEADFQFHHEIVKASHNPFLLQSVESLRELYQRSLNFSLKQNIGRARKRKQVYEEHLKIYEAIMEGNDKAAAYFMKRHLINARIKLGDKRIEPLSEHME